METPSLHLHISGRDVPRLQWGGQLVLLWVSLSPCLIIPVSFVTPVLMSGQGFVVEGHSWLIPIPFSLFVCLFVSPGKIPFGGKKHPDYHLEQCVCLPLPVREGRCLLALLCDFNHFLICLTSCLWFSRLFVDSPAFRLKQSAWLLKPSPGSPAEIVSPILWMCWNPLGSRLFWCVSLLFRRVRTCSDSSCFWLQNLPAGLDFSAPVLLCTTPVHLCTGPASLESVSAGWVSKKKRRIQIVSDPVGHQITVLPLFSQNGSTSSFSSIKKKTIFFRNSIRLSH